MSEDESRKLLDKERRLDESFHVTVAAAFVLAVLCILAAWVCRDHGMRVSEAALVFFCAWVASTLAAAVAIIRAVFRGYRP